MSIEELVGTKGALSSKTIIGAAAVLIAVGLQAFGVEVEVGAVETSLNELIAMAGGVLAIYGRISAKQPVRGVF